MRISNGPHNRALSHSEVGEPEHNTHLFTLRQEGGILYNPKCYKIAGRGMALGQHFKIRSYAQPWDM